MMSPLDYDQLFEEALYGVIRTVLQRIAEEGLPGEHHFYISFRTGASGVVVPDHLRARYPDEMTIVLQHQFWGLKVGEDSFEVTLSFNDAQEQVRVPFAAITSFVDPSLRFGLQFRGGKDRSAPMAPARQKKKSNSSSQPAVAPDKNRGAETAPQAEGDRTADVIPLDTFRRK